MPDPTDRAERTISPRTDTGGRLNDAAGDLVGPAPPDQTEKVRDLERGGVLPPLKIEGAPQKQPRIGTEVTYKGEKLTVVGETSRFDLLYKAGRNAMYASIALQVSDSELKEKYDKVAVTVEGGKEKVRYIAKPVPGGAINQDRSVYFVLERPDGSKILWTDHAFTAVQKADTTGGARVEAKERKPQTDPSATDRAGARPGDSAGSKTPDAAGDKSSGTKPDAVSSAEARIQDAKWRDGSAAEERARLVDGVEVKVRSPKDGMPWREVEINGKTVRLNQSGTQQWFYSEGQVPKDGQVKLHVAGVSEADLMRLQKELLPMLEEMRLKGEIDIYKTFDPNFIDGRWKTDKACYSTVPSPEGQNSKAFTIYLPQEKAEKVANLIDQHLKKSGLVLDGHKGNSAAEQTRLKSESKRVTVERDNWKRTSNGEVDGALLDEALSRKLHEKYAKTNGTTKDGRLTEDGLRAAEKAAGIKANQLCYDTEGRLMFDDANYSSDRATNGRFYVDESQASKKKGHMTGRPALYALYEEFGLDPAKVYTDQLKSERAVGAATTVPPDRVVPTADRLAGEETRPKRDGTLERTKLRTGDVLARETLENRERVEPREIETLKRQAEELATSEKAEDRQKGEALKEVAHSLEGKNGSHAQEAAHRKVLAEAQRAAERGAGGYGKAIAGGTIAIGILVGAALAAYRASQGERHERINRARISK